MRLKFTKMQGAGNDFVVLDARGAAFDLTADRRRAIADRRLGVGCDQLIVLEPPTERDADVSLFGPLPTATPGATAMAADPADPADPSEPAESAPAKKSPQRNFLPSSHLRPV